MGLGCFMAVTGMALPRRASYGMFTLYHIIKLKTVAFH